MKLVWQKVKKQLKTNLPDFSYMMWIAPLDFIDTNDNKIVLSCPNSFFAQRLKKKYLNVFKENFSQFGYADMDFEFNIVPFKNDNSKKKKETSISKSKLPFNNSWGLRKTTQMSIPGFNNPLSNGRMLKQGFTFDDFVVGNNSDYAYRASLSLARGQLNTSNIIYLLSDTGLGKTHLSRSVGHHILANTLTKNVYYVTAEDFTNEMIFSLKQKTIDQFKDKYRKKCDILILEDIHFLSGKMATQKELTRTLDNLCDADKKIVFTGCESPKDIPKLTDQLRSRLSYGLVAQIDPPDYKTRLKILNAKSKKYGYKISNNVNEYLAQELCDNVRQLESGLLGVAKKADIMGLEIDIELTKSVLSNIKKSKKRITIESIKELVCKEFAITPKEIISSLRKSNIVKPRQIAIFLARKYTDQSLKSIGKAFNRYHATTIYSINAIEKELKQKGALFEQIKYLCRKIESGKS